MDRMVRLLYRNLVFVAAAVVVIVLLLAGRSLAQTISSGGSLERGQGIYSSNGQYYFVMQDDGNLVLYRSGGAALWATGTNGIAIRHAVMQGDGNLVLYDYAGAPRWASGTHGQPGSYLVVQDDGNVVIYRPEFPLWASNTQQSTQACSTRTILWPGEELLPGDGRASPNGWYYLAMQGDGNLVLYDHAGAPRWASGTHGHPGAFLDVQCDGNLVIYESNVAVWATNTVQN